MSKRLRGDRHLDYCSNMTRQPLLISPPPTETFGGLWNITAMLSDAQDGLFGEAIHLPMSFFGTSVCDPRDLKRAKIDAFKQDPTILGLPVLLCRAPDGAVSTLMDGRHRITALRELGSLHFVCWHMPEAAAWDYRFDPELLNMAAALLLAFGDAPKPCIGASSGSPSLMPSYDPHRETRPS